MEPLTDEDIEAYLQMTPEEQSSLEDALTVQELEKIQDFVQKKEVTGLSKFVTEATAKAAGALADATGEPEGLVQMEHPALQENYWRGRGAVKNLGNTSSSVKYLEEQFPNLKFEKRGGETYITDSAFPDTVFTLDPDTGFQPIDEPREALKDVGDVLTDVGKGVASGIAGAAGGLKGAALGLPLGMPGVGALTGAATAAGATETALDLGRQGLGSLAGVNEGVNLDEALSSGAITAALTPLLGTGASVKQAVAAGVNPRTQSGLVKRAGRAVTENLGALMSPFTKQEIRLGKEMLPQMLARGRKEAPAMQREITEKAMERASAAVEGQRQKVGQELGQMIEEIGGTVDISSAKQTMQQLGAKLKEMLAKPGGSGLREEELAQFDEVYRKYFGKTRDVAVPGKPKEQSSVARYLGEPLEFEPSTTRKEWFEIPDHVSGWEAYQLDKDLSNLAEIGRGADRYRGPTVTAFEKDLMRLASQAKKEVSGALQLATKDVDTVYGVKGIQGLRGRYKEVLDLEKELKALTGDNVAQADSLLRNLDNPGNAVKKARLQQMDKDYGTGLVRAAEEVNIMSLLGDPQGAALSRRGATSTTATATAAAGARAVGLPASVGIALGTPKGIKAAMTAGHYLNRILDRTDPIARIGTKEWLDEQRGLNP